MKNKNCFYEANITVIYKPDKGSRWKKKITDQYHIWILMQKLNEIGYGMQHYIKKLYTINK